MLVVSLEFIRVLQPPRTPTARRRNFGFVRHVFPRAIHASDSVRSAALAEVLRVCGHHEQTKTRNDQRYLPNHASGTVQRPDVGILRPTVCEIRFRLRAKSFRKLRSDDAKRFFPFEIRRRVQRTRANAHLRNVLQSSKNNQNRRIGQEVELGHRSCGKMDRKLDSNEQT